MHHGGGQDEDGIHNFELWASQTCAHAQFSSVVVGSAEFALDVRLAYRRCLEFDASDAPGQDAAAVRGDRSFVVAVVADGVGQSFFGNLAARHLCGWLIRTLWARRALPPSAEDLAVGLHAEERVLAEMVGGISIDDGNLLKREALRRAQQKGSQAVFSALLWDVVGGHGHLYQVGNVTATVVCEPGDRQEFAADPAGRWSTGSQSQLRLRQHTVDSCSQIILQSDGVSSRWRLDDLNETMFDALAAECATDDDVAIVAISLVRRTEAQLVMGTHAERPEEDSAPPSLISLVGEAAPSTSVAREVVDTGCPDSPLDAALSTRKGATRLTRRHALRAAVGFGCVALVALLVWQSVVQRATGPSGVYPSSAVDSVVASSSPASPDTPAITLPLHPGVTAGVTPGTVRCLTAAPEDAVPAQSVIDRMEMHFEREPTELFLKRAGQHLSPEIWMHLSRDLEVPV